MKLSFSFPEGKIKALTFSYDDGAAPDERLVEIFNRHGLKATFNLNAVHYLDKPEEKAGYLKKLYAGHEIACHGKTHPFFERLPQMSLVEDILEDRRELEKLTGKIINGMAYPYGTYDSNVIQTLRSLGIVYSRTVKSTGRFGFPDDIDFNLPGIFQLLLDLFGDVLGEEECLSIVDLLWFDDDADLAPCLDSICLFDALE